MKYISFLLIFLFFILSCTDDIQDKKIEPITIDIQPFSDIAKDKVDFVYKELSKVYPKIEIKKPIDLPAMAYYKLRNRYRADSLIRFLRKQTTKGHLIIALTTKDISWTKGKISDYGIMGLGLCPGQVCVASSYRLAKENNLRQLFVVSIHELGHTQGLPHCPIKTCFMRDAEGGNPTNEETEFCPKCKAYLVSRGWAL